jgi:hypothetical protein
MKNVEQGATLTVGDTCHVSYWGHDLVLTVLCTDANDQPYQLTLTEFDVARLARHVESAKDHLLWTKYDKSDGFDFTQRTYGDES